MSIKKKWNKRYFHIKHKRIRIGLRTLKTAAAVIISMMIIASMGLSSSKMIFAMLGAMATMENTFRDSIEACLTQVIGLTFGAVMGMLLLSSPIPPLIDAGIGIILIISLYNQFHIRYSPALPCLIMVTLCTATDIQPLEYALGRLAASGVGLLVGLAINTLVFPYDNSSKIRAAIDYLDKELLCFLEDLFDGDDHLPDTERMNAMIDDMKRQLRIFSGQSFVLHRSKKRRQLELYKKCMGKERQLIAHMEVLSRMNYPGRLNEENRERLKKKGAVIRDPRHIDKATEIDTVTNYHVEQLLMLRLELMNELKIFIDFS